MSPASIRSGGCLHRIKMRSVTMPASTRRRDVKQAVLDGPGTEAVNLDALRNCYGTILMPSKRPISAWRFVKQDRSHPTCVA